MFYAERHNDGSIFVIFLSISNYNGSTIFRLMAFDSCEKQDKPDVFIFLYVSNLCPDVGTNPLNAFPYEKCQLVGPVVYYTLAKIPTKSNGRMIW